MACAVIMKCSNRLLTIVAKCTMDVTDFHVEGSVLIIENIHTYNMCRYSVYKPLYVVSI